MDDTSTPRRVNAEAAGRAQEAAALRVQGLDWATIAARCGYSHPNSAGRAVREYLGHLPQPDREEARQVWRARIELLWEEAMEDVHTRRPGAVRAAAALAQRAAQLDGLDQPSRVEFYAPSEVEYSAVLNRMLQLDREHRGVQALEADPFDPEFLYVDAEPEVAESAGDRT